MRDKSKIFYLTAALVLCTVLSMSLGLILGAFTLVFNQDILGMTAEKWRIIWELRAPRVLCCAIVGALLACCGVISQTILKNSLACPYTLGISQLASLIIFSFLYLKFSAALSIVLFIFLLLFLLYRGVASIKSQSIGLSQTLILLGLAVGTFCSSIILAFQFALDGISLMQMTRWLMGSLSVVGYSAVLPLFLVLSVLFALSFYRAEDFDWLCLGDEIALSRGVAVKKITLTFAALIFISVAAVVYAVGPIGFVGLIIPHAVRLLGIVKHRPLLLLSALLGSSFLCLSDVISRTVLSPVEIPIGVVTGILGTPVFVFLLIRSQILRNG